MRDVIIREFNSTLDDAKKLKKIDHLTFNDCKYSEKEIIDIVSGLVATNNVASKKIFEKQEFSKLDKDFHLFLHDEKLLKIDNCKMQFTTYPQ